MTIIQKAEEYYNQSVGVHLLIKQCHLQDNTDAVDLYDALMDKAKFYLELAKKETIK
jgi:hypothetical protein